MALKLGILQNFLPGFVGQVKVSNLQYTVAVHYSRPT